MAEDLSARVSALEAEVARLRAIVDGAPPAAGGTGGGLPPEVVELALAGRKIEAIKLLRDRTGLGLADAKAVVDAIG